MNQMMLLKAWDYTEGYTHVESKVRPRAVASQPGRDGQRRGVSRRAVGGDGQHRGGQVGVVRWSPQSALLHVLSSHADKGPPLTGPGQVPGRGVRG